MERKSKTYQIKVGCGNLYVTVEFTNDDKIHKIKIHRNSKFRCSLVSREKLAKQTTYQLRRDPKQLIKDLKGDICEAANITVKSAKMKGLLYGMNCSDGIGRLVERLIKEEKECQTTKQQT